MSIVFLRRRGLGAGSTSGIVREAEEMGCRDFRIVRSWVPDELASLSGDDVVIRWGCTATVPLRSLSTVIPNTAASIHWCANKREGRLQMQQAGVPVPQTWTAEGFHSDVARGVPPDGMFVLRPAFHSQGRQLWYGDAAAIHEEITRNRLTDSGYVSRLVEKVAEYRVFCFQNRAVWVARKTPGNPDQVAWNVAQGGRFDNVRWSEWPKSVVIAALAAAKVSGTSFCGVDVMADADGNPYVLEVNSAPSQTSPYRQRCVAKAFMFAYAGEADSRIFYEDVPDGPRRTYKSYIHPALKDD